MAMNTLDKDESGNPRPNRDARKSFKPIGLPALAAAVRRNNGAATKPDEDRASSDRRIEGKAGR